MFTFSLPRTDSDRLELLNTIFRNSLSTPKEQLAFSPELVVYLRPFIGKLSMSMELGDSSDLKRVRSVVDELLVDIFTEMQANDLFSQETQTLGSGTDFSLALSAFNPFEVRDNEMAMAA